MNKKYDSTQFMLYPIALEGPKYASLSVYSKHLYMILNFRTALSEKSGWVDAKNCTYIYFTIDEITEELGVCRQKAVDYLDELTSAQLIKRVKQGAGRPNRIYVFAPKDD